MTFWTKEQEDAHKDLSAKGYSASQIGEAIGKSRNAVIGKWRRDGDGTSRPRRPYRRNAGRNNLLKQLWISGYSRREIAEQLDTTQGAVQSRIYRMQAAQKEKFARKRRPSSQAKLENRAKAMERREILLGKTAKSSAEKPPKTAIKFLNLKSNSCRYVFGEADGINTLFCGKKAYPGFSYCVGHARLCIDPMHHHRRRIRVVDRDTAGSPTGPAA